MLSATRRWVSRHRTPLAVGVGIVGAGYVAAQYLVSKIRDDRERLGGERIAKENLRRRFEQNQEDCTFTVLALLPTATANILDAMNTERITLEIQQMRGSGGSGVRSSLRASASAPPSIADTTISMTDDDGRSMVSLPAEGGGGSGGNGGPGRGFGVDGQPLSTVDEGSTRDAQGTAEGGEGQAEQGGSSSPPQQQQSPPSQSQPFLAPSLVPPGPKRKTKRQLWDELAISSITRAFTLVYTLALLTLITRVQLNLLGRRSYLSSVVSLATGPAQAPISLENHDDDNIEPALGAEYLTNRRYLTFSWWLLNRGWLAVRDRVEAAVRRAYGHLSPRDSLSLAEFKALAEQVRDEVEGRGPGAVVVPDGRWLECLLPPRDEEETVLRESGILDEIATSAPPPLHPIPSQRQQQQQQQQHHRRSSSSSPAAPSLRHLLDETADLIESVPFSHVLTQLLDAGFSLLLDQRLAEGAFESPSPLGNNNNDQNEHNVPESARAIVALNNNPQKRTLLPKMLSVLTRQAHVIGNGMPNEYLQEMERVRELESFAAVVYSSNWENEIRAHSEGHEEATAARSTAPSASAAAAAHWAPATNAAEALRRKDMDEVEASAAARGMAASGWSVVVPASGASLAESGVVVDSPASLEDAWSRAFDKS